MGTNHVKYVDKVTVAKFGGSTIGTYGDGISGIVERIRYLVKESKIVAVFSAPLAKEGEEKLSITDIMLEIGTAAEDGTKYDFGRIERVYEKMLNNVPEQCHQSCKEIIKVYLDKCVNIISSLEKEKFVDEVRSKALAYSGELLMSEIMNDVLKKSDLSSAVISFNSWPIITDDNIEYTNFLYSASKQHMHEILKLVKTCDVVTIGGFVGKTTSGVITTYERGGSDRTAVDIGILLQDKFTVSVDFEKDVSVYSADPKIVDDGSLIKDLSYNEAKLAATFGMKILDPIAIKDIQDCGTEIPLTISNTSDPKKFTIIHRDLNTSPSNPLKIVAGKKNCAILRMEKEPSEKMLHSLENKKRYSEFVILSPFSRDGLEFVRILFLDGDYVKRNNKYFLAFDSLASITYKRAAITLIGDEMWRVQNIVAKISARLGKADINILNMDAQEETSRVIIITEDTGDVLERSIQAIHIERAKITTLV
ncbi:MAG: amino acid kinase [Cenarchaeum symbiont of Oopsacas minuta]|nr:amino acid kinase [Cenarchaeum symbiont of Oopsacas minuta]